MNEGKRIAIAGGPRSGKSTVARELERETDIPVYSTDDTKHLEWSRQSASVASWFDRNSPFIIEGVAVIRALRKWCQSHETGKPVDEVVYCKDPMAKRTDAQEVMSRGTHSVWLQVLPELRRRGVKVRYADQIRHSK